MSKTIEEIKDEYARSFAYKDWKELKSNESVLTIARANDEVAERYAQSKTQDLQEQNKELVGMLEYIFYKTNFQNHFPTTSIKVKNLLTKYNYLNKKP